MLCVCCLFVLNFDVACFCWCVLFSWFWLCLLICTSYCVNSSARSIPYTFIVTIRRFGAVLWCLFNYCGVCLECCFVWLTDCFLLVWLVIVLVLTVVEFYLFGFDYLIWFRWLFVFMVFDCFNYLLDAYVFGAFVVVCLCVGLF